jgi:hypothetical protein
MKLIPTVEIDREAFVLGVSIAYLRRWNVFLIIRCLCFAIYWETDAPSESEDDNTMTHY